MADREATSSPQHTNPIAGLLRMTWMALAPVGSVLLLFVIGTGSRGTVTWSDLMLLGTVLAGVAARYVDIAYFRGDTADGAPATMRDFGGYTAKLAIGVGAVWALVHGSAML